MLTLACHGCGRTGRVNVAELLDEWGEHSALSDVSAEIVAGCPRRRFRSVYGQCGVYWPELPKLLARRTGD